MTKRLPFATTAGLVLGLTLTSLPSAAQDAPEEGPVKRWPSAASQVTAAPDATARVARARTTDPQVSGADPVRDSSRLEQRRNPGGGGGGRDGGGRDGGGRVGGGRDRGDDGPRVAVPRGGSRPVPSGRPGSTVVVRPRSFYYGSGFYDPFGYSYYGPGFYDAYWFGNAGWGTGWGPGWRAGGIYGGYGGYGYDFGRLRLQVRPRDAEVFIDGYYAGQVDDFDGRLQSLSLETGGYSVEVRKAGWETLTFDVRVTPGRTTTYRGELIPQKP